jgi:methionyl-tRNA formyltransferase
VYAGTPDFAVAPLERLVLEGFSPEAVFTQPDRRSGRGRKLTPSPVKSSAESTGIPVFQPESLAASSVAEEFAALRPDLVVVVAYGLILPAEILKIPIHGCWNIHASLLPRWRGAAPIQRAIEAGDVESGICIMQMDEGLDTGDILGSISIPLEDHETAGTLHDRLSALGASALMECVRTVAAGERIIAIPQQREGVSYARKLEKSEAQIDWSDAAVALERKIRAFNPWPVAWCDIGGERTRIWHSHVVTSDQGLEPGTVISANSQGIDIATGNQALRLLELQKPGGRRLSALDYLNAQSLPGKLTRGS